MKVLITYYHLAFDILNLKSNCFQHIAAPIVFEPQKMFKPEKRPRYNKQSNVVSVNTLLKSPRQHNKAKCLQMCD
jgi:hypothetical protein